jgi:hypothetical protein
MKRPIALFTLAFAGLSLAAVAAADPGGHGKGHQRGHDKTRHGKFTFTFATTDNGSCGTAWANDTVRRTFVLKDNGNGTFRLTHSDRGTFTTIGGTSPGSCAATSAHGKTVRAGVTGKVVGFLRGTVTGGTVNPNATCTGATCGSTATFLATFFGAGAQFSCLMNATDCKFNFNYTAAHHQSLLFRHWQDKGTGAGTSLAEHFKGDIADA